MWIGTYNNIDPLVCESYLEKWHKSGCAYVTGQLEKGKEGTPHLQFFLQFAKPQRLSALKKHDKTSHFEPVKFNNGADTYCNKDETRVDGPWTYGAKPFKNNVKGEVAKRNAMLMEKGAEQGVLDGDIRLEQYRNVSAAIDEIKLKLQTPYTAPQDRGYWLYGPSRTGKSTWARE